MNREQRTHVILTNQTLTDSVFASLYACCTKLLGFSWVLGNVTFLEDTRSSYKSSAMF